MNRIPDWLLHVLEVVCSFLLSLVLTILMIVLIALYGVREAVVTAANAIHRFLQLIGETLIDGCIRAFGYEQEGENDE
ncbi:hypothetical protein [Pseudanabaena sp. PCC 6802]|uniref:hypothetical protein n=1 Tax=Pseudanabaena sp. PCC 6802 TaxID=118173 RepID=UPI000347ADEE|nr:hypothetical protein [Pseudanabaena sp. PCC 6802]